MKEQHKKQQAGVWIDTGKAWVIAPDPDGESGAYSIQDKIKAGENQSGGSEHSMNNAKQTDLLKFFKSLSGKLSGFDELFIFGPGKSQEQLHNHLKEDGQFKNKKISISSADHLTEPQMLAKVREFFK
jgi:hypothetical protein